MATEEREPADPLKLAQALLAQASRTDFLALVPLLERLTPDAVRVGGDGPPSKEALRFRHDPSMGFSAGDMVAGVLAQVAVSDSDSFEQTRTVMELTTTFLGLSGAASPLPLYIPAEIAQTNAGENVQARFLDIFHHRLLSLFYRLWTRYDYAREFRSDCEDIWSKRIATMAAPAHATRTRASRIPRHKLLTLAPLLVQRARSSRSLVLALEDILDLPEGHVRVVQLVGGFAPLDDEQRMRLSHDTAVLGRNAVLGSQVYERGSRFRIQLGPISVSEYPDYVDRGERIELLREVVDLMVREPLDYDLELFLGDDALPGFPLRARQGVRLGLATRLRASGNSQTVLVRNVGRTATA